MVMLITDVLKATPRLPTMSFTVLRFGNFSLSGPPTWRLASADCCWLGSESSPRVSLTRSPAPCKSLPLQGGRPGERRLRNAANWASLRAAGEAGAVGGRRGSEGPLEVSVTHSYYSPAPCASASPRLQRLFVKRGRGSLALARPHSCLAVPPRGYGPASRPTSHKPAAAAAEAATTTADAERIPRPEVRAVQTPSHRAPRSPPPSSSSSPPPPPPPPLGP